MIKFAYLDHVKILHVVKEEKTAKLYSANGKIIQTGIKTDEKGYPADEEGKGIIVYDETDLRYDAKSKKLNPEDFPEMVELYKQCK